MKPVRYAFEQIIDGWGVCLGQGGRWHVMFGDSEQSIFSGTYRKRRRAKKEITHYIQHGAAWCQHGMLKQISELQKGGV